MDNNGNDAHALSAHIDRIEGFLDQRKKLGETIRAAYDQAESEGIPKKGLQALIKERASDLEKAAQIRVQVERMRKALASLTGTPLGEWATAAIATQTAARKRGNSRGNEHAEA